MRSRDEILAGAGDEPLLEVLVDIRDLLAAEGARRAENDAAWNDAARAIYEGKRYQPVTLVSAESQLDLAVVEERFLGILAAHRLSDMETIAADLIYVLRVELVKGASR